ncbi:SDR family NAD(P)-dependent oxidoreductase [Ferrovibrio terrae]|uniref:SDR family NAD(P)-dependent oxidoreductase n=1 Tax=Ferrovibrio terrae TaxID=2594003 RepID=A0A516H1Q6_9PROT|nr:SDR family NAD(P)-dependent oxidoreductase [Ferrovibrio terrae]QDO97707.1 SDR family NAD(P)-dependent oxidoreductase [Ferrovibrio terrae]
MTRIVIIGATSAIAEHCARQWIASAEDIVLVGRNLAALSAVARDLRVRNSQASIDVMVSGLVVTGEIESVAEAIFQRGRIDIVLIAHGYLPQQESCQHDLALCGEAMVVNGISPVLWCEAFATRLEKAGRGTLAVIGSVAGDRGRKSNYVYGAAKGLIARYVEGLRHRLAASKVRVILVKPGPTDTPMTAALKEDGGRLANPRDVARTIVDGIATGKSTIYAPRKWAWIMMVVRHLPESIFNQLDI